MLENDKIFILTVSLKNFFKKSFQKVKNIYLPKNDETVTRKLLNHFAVSIKVL